MVIGGGTAGACAAISAARAGMSTLIASPLPRNATARDRASISIHPGVLDLLGLLDAGDAVTRASRVTYAGIWVAGRFTALGEDANGAWLGHHVDRHAFETGLLSHAIENGVQLRDSAALEIGRTENRVRGATLADGTDVVARFTIDASGSPGLAARSLGFRQRFASNPLLVRTGLATGIGTRFGPRSAPRFIPRPDGWTWLAPEIDGRCTWTDLRRKGTRPSGLPPEFGTETVPESAHCFNMRWRLTRPLANDGFLVAGDAAGTLDPAAGQGVLLAILTGLKAAEAACRCIRDPNGEQRRLAYYDAWLSELFDRRAAQLKTHYRTLGIDV